MKVLSVIPAECYVYRDGKIQYDSQYDDDCLGGYVPKIPKEQEVIEVTLDEPRTTRLILSCPFLVTTVLTREESNVYQVEQRLRDTLNHSLEIAPQDELKIEYPKAWRDWCNNQRLRVLIPRHCDVADQIVSQKS